jgi:CubicO group peptidase (beta-lactamase class C family)
MNVFLIGALLASSAPAPQSTFDMATSADEVTAGAPLRQAGSIAKYACTLAALRLENAGSLSLDAPVHELIEGYEGPTDRTLTLRRLLENRSGLADGLRAALQSDPDLPSRSIPSAEAANRFAASAGSHAPGEAFAYLNSNWILVQAILEQAASAPIADLLETWVFDPAGAETAAVFVGDVEDPSARPASGRYMPLPDFITCAAGLQAQPADLLAITSYPFLDDHFDADDRAQLMTLTTPEQNYTIGGRIQRVIDADGDERWISWQSGSNGPWSAVAVFDPATGAGFAAMSQDGPQELAAAREQWLQSHGFRLLQDSEAAE